MAYTRKQERNMFLIMGLIFSVVIGISIICFYEYIKLPQIKQVVEQKFKEKIKSEQVDVYITKENVKQGEKIEVLSKKIGIPKYMLAEKTILENKQLHNKIARIDITKNTIIVSSMLQDEEKVLTDDTRYQDYSNIKLPMNLKKGDVIDVRIKHSTGADDIILAKKEVLEIVNSIVWMKINEQERIMMNLASNEVKQNTEELYATIYVDKENQPKAEVNYKIN